MTAVFVYSLSLLVAVLSQLAHVGVSGADQMFHLIALVIAASIVAHSSTDVLVARWFRRTESRAAARHAGHAETVS